jgi:DNA invertase Pin-like site-specific DNA recombinase
MSAPSGRAMAGMVLSFAEFEREIVHERLKAGIEIPNPQNQASRKKYLPIAIQYFV